MENLGITRRIDNLGRIVIPKEIRRNLRIKDNDQIEINTYDNKIVLNKYDYLKKDKVISLLIMSLRKKINKNIIYTSRDKIIEKSLVDKNNEVFLLDNEIINIIESRKESFLYRDNLFLYIKPIIINGDLFGSLIIYDKSEILKEEIFIIDYLSIFLENYLE